MRWLDPLGAASVAVIVALLSGGCSRLWWSFVSTPDPHATGTWTGRLVPVTVRDYRGREYRAAAVDIETGPRLLKGPGAEWPVHYDQDLALLVRGRGIIDPEELGIRAGSKVKVSGTLARGSPIESLAPEGSTGGIVEPVRMVSEAAAERNNGLVLDIGGRGKPRVLKE